MKEILKTTRLDDRYDYVYVSDHYDIHLRGLCRYKTKLCYFTTDYDTEDTIIYSLRWHEKIKGIFKKKIFEWCVGYHWTYPQREEGAEFYYRKPELLFVILFNLYYWKFTWNRS